MILVTGAAGFIGSVLAARLNRRGRTDLVLCDGLRRPAKWMNLRGVRCKCFIHRDELFERLERDSGLASSIDAVLHMGACTDTTERDMDMLLERNFEYTRRLCEWALERGARFIYASSAAVYGDGSLGFSDDHDLIPRLRPLNEYGFSKWMCDAWMYENGLLDRVAGLRFFNVFGPNEYHKGRMASVIYNAFPPARDEGLVRLFESHVEGIGHGEQARDFVHVDHVVDAVLFVLDNGLSGIYNVGRGEANTFNTLARALLKGLGKEPRIEYFPMPEDLRGKYQYYTKADMSKLRAAGFEAPSRTFEEDVIDYVRRYLAPGLHYADVDEETRG